MNLTNKIKIMDDDYKYAICYSKKKKKYYPVDSADLMPFEKLIRKCKTKRGQMGVLCGYNWFIDAD